MISKINSMINVKPATCGMTPDKAAGILKDNFGLFDTAAGIGGKDGLIGRNDLEAIVRDNPGLPGDVRAAAQYLLDNPAAFNQLDVSAGIGNLDGLIGRNDVDSFTRSGAPSPAAQKALQSDPFAKLDPAYVKGYGLRRLLKDCRPPSVRAPAVPAPKAQPQPPAEAAPAPAPQTPSAPSQGGSLKDAAATLKKYYCQYANDGDGWTEGRLRRMLGRPDCPADLQQAINTVLNGGFGRIAGAMDEGKLGLLGGSGGIIAPLGSSHEGTGITDRDLNTFLSAGYQG